MTYFRAVAPLLAAGVMSLCLAFWQSAQAGDLIALKNFSATTGTTPYDSVIRLPNGSLWMTTSTGTTGTTVGGTIAKYSSLNNAIVPVATLSTATGLNSFAPLTLGLDGNFYGVAEFGGAHKLGTIMQITQAGVVTPIYSFKGTGDGANPYGGLVQGSDGTLYGTTLDSSNTTGATGFGTIFKCTTAGALTTLHTFTGTNTSVANSDGANPQSAMTIASDGKLYGVTRYGGFVDANSQNFGTIFRIGTDGTGYAILHNFAGDTDGEQPFCQLFQAADGNLYGTTNLGTIFKISLTGTFTALYTFSATNESGANADGASPSGSLVQLSDGSIYGTVQAGGTSGNGGVFRLKPAGSGEALVYSFSGTPNAGVTDGVAPVGGLTLGQDGNLYGTASGAYTVASACSVFELFGQPVVSSFSPTTVNAGGGATTVTINGANFNTNGVTVTMNGTALVVNAVTATTITVTVPANLLTTAGTANIVVSNDPNIPVSATAHLQIVTAVPAITSLSPSSTVAGSPQFTLSVNGTGFVVSGETVTLGGTALAITSATGTQIQATVPASLVASASVKAVIVNDNNGSAASNSVNFSILAPVSGQPTISSLSPSSIAAESASFALTINGANFVTSGETVTFAGNPLTVTSATSTVLKITVPANLVATAGVANVIVNNNNGKPVSNAASFTITAAAPKPPILATLTPNSAVAGTASVTITITGTNFNTGGVKVNFGSTALSISSLGASQVKALIPAAALTTAGPVAVTVNNNNGAGNSNALTFTVKPATAPTPLHTFAAGLQMIAMPYDYSTQDPALLLGLASIKLAVWLPASSVYAVTPTTPADHFRLGQGYWIRLGTGGANLISAGTKAPTTQPFSIALKTGWNMIGDPFTTAVKVPTLEFFVGSSPGLLYSTAVSTGIVQPALYTFSAGATAYTAVGPADSLQPYAGYWIDVTQDCTLEITPGS